MRLAVFQHVPFEGPAAIADWASSHGHELVRVPLYETEHLPSLVRFDGLIVMGGPMSVQDQSRYPWLGHEIDAIRSEVESGRRVLGICLGAQLLAHVLGADVYPGPFKEIGWYPIKRAPEAAQDPMGEVFPEEATVFHWHGDTFDLPQGATRLASSAGVENQVFVRGKVLGLQCHLEATEESVSSLVHHCVDEIGDGPYEGRPEDMIEASVGHATTLRPILRAVLNRWASL